MDGIERIKVLASEITNKPMLKVIDHLLLREDMNEKYLSEEKSLKQMISFIRQEAEKQAEDGCAMLEEKEVYSLAIHYWDETNENLGLIEENTKEDKPEELDKNNAAEEIQKVKRIVPIKDTKPKWIPEGQLSLF